jgi:hypothetical protein
LKRVRGAGQLQTTASRRINGERPGKIVSFAVIEYQQIEVVAQNRELPLFASVRASNCRVNGFDSKLAAISVETIDDEIDGDGDIFA